MHQIEYLTYEGTLSLAEIEKSCNRIAEGNSDSGSGLYKHIQFMHNKKFNSYDEAYEYLDSLSTHNYEQYAVPYCDVKLTASKRLQDKEQKLREIYQKLRTATVTVHYTPKTVKSEFIGCKNCGSRIAVKYIHSNDCPVCRNDLRPKTTLDKVAALQKSYDELKAQVTAMQREENAKLIAKTKKVPMKWLVRIEYHC